MDILNILVLIDYFLSIFLVVLCLLEILVYFIAKKLTGNFIGKTGFTKGKIIFLYSGLASIMMVFILIFAFLYFHIPIQMSLMSIAVILLTSGLLSICEYFTSKIIVGSNGISLPYAHFFYQKDKLVGYKIENSYFTFMRRGKKDVTMKLRDEEVSKLEFMMKTLGF